MTTTMNVQLDQLFTRAEIEKFLHQMPPLKLPSHDGFGACFFQKDWNTMEDDVGHSMLKVLRGEGMNS